MQNYNSRRSTKANHFSFMFKKVSNYTHLIVNAIESNKILGFLCNGEVPNGYI